MSRNHSDEETVSAAPGDPPRDGVRVAVADPALRARVTERTPLRYADGSDASLDRPAHVRSASSLAMFGGRLAVVQDDANFVAFITLTDGRVDSIALPASDGGIRQFDDLRGNKRLKLDLEASVVDVHDGRATLFAFGSGSSPAREHVAIITGAEGGPMTIRMTAAHALYATLRATPAFRGSELNVEGAALMGDELWLFGRGNGAPRDGSGPLNATCVFPWALVRDHLRGPTGGTIPRPAAVTRYDLGVLGTTALGFTDALPLGRSFLYSAAAEDSPDAITDGPVAGSCLGVIPSRGAVRWSPLLDAAGGLFDGKVEGIAWAGPARDRLTAVLDHDQPGTPSELCVIELEGPWFED